MRELDLNSGVNCVDSQNYPRHGGNTAVEFLGEVLRGNPAVNFRFEFFASHTLSGNVSVGGCKVHDYVAAGGHTCGF
jgi:hypothetical protein